MVLKKFHNFLKNERHYSIHTIRAYLYDVKVFFEFCSFQKYKPSLVTFNHIRLWVVDLKKNKQSAKTINRKISSLKTFFNFCEREQFVTCNPILKLKSLKQKKRLPIVVSENSLRKLFTTSNIFSDDFSGKRDRLILDLFYQTGIRLSELINIRLIDVIQDKKHLHIVGKRNKMRIIPLTSSILESLEIYLLVRNQVSSSSVYLFVTNKGKKTYAKMIYRLVKRYLSLVSTVEKISPHVLRHAFATHLLNNGADLNAIKELLGHSSLLSTQIYTHVSSEKIKQEYSNSHPRG